MAPSAFHEQMLWNKRDGCEYIFYRGYCKLCGQLGSCKLVGKTGCSLKQRSLDRYESFKGRKIEIDIKVRLNALHLQLSPSDNCTVSLYGFTLVTRQFIVSFFYFHVYFQIYLLLFVYFQIYLLLFMYVSSHGQLELVS